MKQIWQIAENTSFDLDNRVVYIKWKEGNTTSLPFEWIKNIYPQIAKLEEHLLLNEKPKER